MIYANMKFWAYLAKLNIDFIYVKLKKYKKYSKPPFVWEDIWNHQDQSNSYLNSNCSPQKSMSVFVLIDVLAYRVLSRQISQK